MSSPNGPVSGYYDRLSRYGAFARLFGRDGGYARSTVHRLLVSDMPGIAPADVVHVRIAAKVTAAPPVHVLDAGCGLGGTSFDLARRFGATCDGVTLSSVQAERAARTAGSLGLAGSCRFRVASYDDPLPAGRYDLIVAIESLAHSPDPACSLANLVRARASGGRVIVVDDVREPSADAGDAALFMEGWQAPGFRTRAEWLAAFEAAGLRLADEEDLTALVPVRAALAREALMALNRVAGAFPHAGWRAILASHRGGLALERLYAAGGASYRLFVAV
ncbi:MAG: methyltransferase domain-containing protein [Rhodospirillales bacterium]|nr:methyltransferase domain-containing protein [Rhodospirillales bacterium]